MKKFLLLPFLIVVPFLFTNVIWAEEESDLLETITIDTYTMEEVAQHDEEGDCWMVFEDGVYDFSEYLPDHDKFMDIREWCGMDMTEDFKDKAGAGRDHREGTYEMLERYQIGVLVDSDPEVWILFTMEEVAQHDEEGNCWMVFENSVYDFSEYLPDHDKFMDIREWCGMDMTEDFKDKAGAGRDHREGTYALLEQYKIGELKGEVDLVDTQILIEDVQEESTKPREYNILIPFVLTTVLYWGMYLLAKRNILFGIHKFDAFWNTVLLLLLLIPGMAFGIFMMVRIKRPELWDIDFDFMYWHVELSLVMGFVAIYHFIQRIPQYIAQMKRKKSV